MSRLTWADLIVEDVSPDQFRDWLAPWLGFVVVMDIVVWQTICAQFVNVR